MAAPVRATARPAFSMSSRVVTPRAALSLSSSALSAGVRMGIIAPSPSGSNRCAERGGHAALVGQRDEDIGHAERVHSRSGRSLQGQAGGAGGGSLDPDIVPAHLVDAAQSLAAGFPRSPPRSEALGRRGLALAVGDLLRSEHPVHERSVTIHHPAYPLHVDEVDPDTDDLHERPDVTPP